MLINIDVHWPKDMKILEEKAAEIIVDILVKRLSYNKIYRLIEALNDESINILL